MKYWETFFLTLGVGCLVGVIVNPQSWFAGPVGIMCSIIGYVINRYRKEYNQ